jgi:hypothetical protein
MARYTIDIPDTLDHEIQERRHQIDVSEICAEALTAAVGRAASPVQHAFDRGHEVTQAINAMFSG